MVYEVYLLIYAGLTYMLLLLKGVLYPSFHTIWRGKYYLTHTKDYSSFHIASANTVDGAYTCTGILKLLINTQSYSKIRPKNIHGVFIFVEYIYVTPLLQEEPFVHSS